MLFPLKASRWTKQKSSRSSIGHLQEISKLFNPSLALPTSTAISSRIIQRRSVHSPISSRNIPISPSMRKLSFSFTNSKRLSPWLPSFPTHHCRDRTDASNYALGAVLSQVSDSGKNPLYSTATSLSQKS
ncbi:hypothetical protein O181_124479 [Austropuccinia psidii MF-1]|uniref:Uncharacterized protein n=1 Tax=Austropuccinia psidii MF-1 TaxID=1389203 RepID=A0A9Q3Q4B2_9BASI|nr:hypothetical protein [Austropuccinia psidii MF-1]